MMKSVIITFSIMLTVGQCFVPSVMYVSFQLNETTKYNSSIDRIIINASDDTPLVEVQLPILFPFFGEFIDRVFVSPNGYVQTSPVNLCRCCFCDPCLADYFGMIAGILSDFNTYDYESSHVSTHQDNLNVTTIYFNQVSFFGISEPLLDFGIRMFPDGAVNILYDNVTHFDTLPSAAANGATNCSWLSGLIAPSTLPGQEFKVTVQQGEVQRHVWSARNPGVYPPSRAEVVSNSHYVMCPISTLWGVTPAVIHNSTEVLNITTLSMSCIEGKHDRNHSISIAIFLSPALAAKSNASNASLDDVSQFIVECDPVEPPGLVQPSPVSFMCNLSSINMSLFKEGDGLFVDIMWRPSVVSETPMSDYRLFGTSEEVPSLMVNFSTTGTDNSAECALNNRVGSCSACDVVQSGYLATDELSCLSLDCDIDEAFSTFETYHTTASFSSFSEITSFQSLYMRPSCNNASCESTFAYDVDNTGECCLIADMDCLGRCNGTSVAGRNAAQGWLQCCSSGQVLDCLGYCDGHAVLDCLGVCGGHAVLDCHSVCNGTAAIDACGVCGGADTSVCPPVSIGVDTGLNPLDSNHHISTEYDATKPMSVSSVPILVSNTNDVAINVSFFYPKKHTLPPFINLPPGIHHIHPFSNMTFNILSNINELFNQSVAWAVNTISIKYSRVPSGHPSYTFAIDVLPFMSNCSNFTNIDTCTSFPGCEFCLGLSRSGRSGDFRILSEQIDTTLSVRDRATEYYYNSSGRNKHVVAADGGGSRALFTSILPFYLHQIQDEDVLAHGYCGTGFSSCDTFSASSAAPPHSCLFNLLSSVLMILCAVSIVMLTV